MDEYLRPTHVRTDLHPRGLLKDLPPSRTLEEVLDRHRTAHHLPTEHVRAP